MWLNPKDEKITSNSISDKIGKEFIGTLEEDAIIYTMLRFRANDRSKN